MKVTILKKHEQYNPNDTLEVSEERAAYWIACGVATAHIPDNEKIDKTLDEKLGKMYEMKDEDFEIPALETHKVAKKTKKKA